jgi:hypothetical protein
MKLFITNKNNFERDCQSSKEAHQNAFSQLSNQVSNGFIPIEILTRDCVFKFKQLKEDVFFYEFLGCI